MDAHAIGVRMVRPTRRAKNENHDSVQQNGAEVDQRRGTVEMAELSL
jgi:hypothetical protein